MTGNPSIVAAGSVAGAQYNVKVTDSTGITDTAGNAWNISTASGSDTVFGPQGFQKGPDGAMTLAAQMLLAPYVISAFINSRAWTRRQPAPVTVADGVALGRLPDHRTAVGFATVVDLCAELPRLHEHTGWHAFPTLDLVVPEPRLLRAAVAAIEDGRAHGPVLVCCALGYSRSAAALATWLVAYGHAGSAATAVERIRSVRPRIVLADDAIAAIARAAEPTP